MAELILILGGPGVVLFVLQLILIRVTRSRLRPLRFASLLTLLIPMTLAVLEWRSGGWFWQLGVALYGVIAVWMLLCWSFAWVGAVGERKDADAQL